MTFSLRPITLKRLSSFLGRNRIFIIFFFVLWIQSAFLGLSDDEAYYWVLAQKPSLGYAFHPPAVAWFISSIQWLFGWIFGTHHAALVRLPAVLSMTLVLFLSVNWLTQLGLSESKRNRAVWVLLSFCGFFPLSWMMVPDIPLFLGWTLLFKSTWSICDEKSRLGVTKDYLFLGMGAALSLLSKYSAVLAIFSSILCIWTWADREKRLKAIGTLIVATLLACIPIVIWNAEHQWGSILYQIRDRHGDRNISWIRFARFWIVEAICAGPITLYFGQLLLRKGVIGNVPPEERKIFSYLTLWILPAAAVFCLQPLISDFKVHWAYVVWWPIFLGLALASQGASWKWIRYQVYYGVSVGILVLLLCHVPIGNWILYRLKGPQFDPKLDVTNDLYGWDQLDTYIRKEFGKSTFNLPIIGSRYQTAAQAAFGMKSGSQVTFLPRDPKEWDEWPDFGVSDEKGPHWPKIKSPVLFVADIRYNEGPGFPDARCQKLGRLEIKRFNLLAKWIDVWRCDPSLGNL